MPDEISWLMPGSLSAAEEADVVNTLHHLDAGTTPLWLHPQAKGVFGRPYRNLPTMNGDALPGTPGTGGYEEYDVAPPAGTATRGPRRVVRNTATGELYYTNTHYGDAGQPSFWRIR